MTNKDVYFILNNKINNKVNYILNNKVNNIVYMGDILTNKLREKILEFIHNGILKKEHCEYSREEIAGAVNKLGTKIEIVQEIKTMAYENVLLKVKNRGKKRITEFYTLPELIERYKRPIKKLY